MRSPQSTDPIRGTGPDPPDTVGVWSLRGLGGVSRVVRTRRLPDAVGLAAGRTESCNYSFRVRRLRRACLGGQRYPGETWCNAWARNARQKSIENGGKVVRLATK